MVLQNQELVKLENDFFYITKWISNIEKRFSDIKNDFVIYIKKNVTKYRFSNNKT